jgi:hypothetical protein
MNSLFLDEPTTSERLFLFNSRSYFYK